MLLMCLFCTWHRVILDLTFQGQDYTKDVLPRMKMLRKGKISLYKDCFVPISVHKTFVQTSAMIYNHNGKIMFRNIYLKVHKRHVKTMVDYDSFTRICSDKR